ncbi:shikimate dehydrogenase [Exilibacterium tricleocarpae]|uniref:Shikimate dehydrogenase (NADP(+)) n=1 Tax=Exilibacterium tricleocarpae TaxID=2591008 RepID=A0A545T0E5_9GAMM|nr:shikimate dehydrogenase [Exilibacterium tricleocarpae]TQV70693.1 shikimate dehydrogenase [Exilibacterium tricleocarpae]
MADKSDQYAVFGNPIAHSKSPQIHQWFARQTRQSITYTRQRVEEGQFESAAARFFCDGGRGLNITAPLKLNAFTYADRVTERAERAGAVNTLALQDDGSVLGDNTDGVGMVTDITANLGWDVSAKRVLILGAGGAVRGVLQPVLEQGPEQLLIANRTVAKALQLSRSFRDLGRVQVCGFEDLADRQFDLVINGTAASLAGDLPPLPDDLLAADAHCYDMMYGAAPTVFLRWARARGAVGIADGLGMLVGQAAESFYLWRGVRPDTAPVIQLLRQELTG